MKNRAGLKWLALGFLAINLMVGFWGWSVRPDSRQPSELGAPSLDRIILLRELTTEEQGRLALAPQSAQTSNPVVPDFQEVDAQDESSPTGCYLYSFTDRDRLPVFLERVKAVATGSYIGQQASQQPGAVMLYIEPMPSFRLAQIELNELRAAGVDGFIIPDGDLANGISVGVFNSEQNIEQRTSQLQRLGYAVERYQYMVDRSIYAVNVPASARARIDAQTWAEIQRDFPQMSSQQNSCWEVASTLNFN